VVLVGASTIFTPVQLNASGIVTSYAGHTLTISITAFNPTGIVLQEIAGLSPNWRSFTVFLDWVYRKQPF